MLRCLCSQEVLDNYILTSNSRGAAPKQVPSKLNGTFEYFTSPYEQRVITWCVPFSALPSRALGNEPLQPTSRSASVPVHRF